MQDKIKGNATVFFITTIWGLTFPLIHNAVKEVDPQVFVTCRLLLALSLFFIVVFRHLPKSNFAVMRGGLILGVFNVGIYLTQTIGMQTVTSARAAFITGSSVILVPFLSYFFKIKRPSRLDFLCAFIGFFGLYILTGSTFKNISYNELWVCLGALLFALQIACVHQVIEKITQPLLLVFYQLLFGTLMSLPFSMGHSFAPILHTQALLGVIFCSIFATCLVFVIQNTFQKFTTASKAALILSAESIFGAFFGWLINQEIPPSSVTMGGIIILISLSLPLLIQIILWLAENKPLKQRKPLL